MTLGPSLGLLGVNRIRLRQLRKKLTSFASLGSDIAPSISHERSTNVVYGESLQFKHRPSNFPRLYARRESLPITTKTVTIRKFGSVPHGGCTRQVEWQNPLAIPPTSCPSGGPNNSRLPSSAITRSENAVPECSAVLK